MADWWTALTIAIVGVVVVLFAVLNPMIGSIVPFGPWHDMKENYKPTGEERVVEILDNDDGCLFEIDGERHITNTGLIIEDSCPFLEGEKAIAYKVRGGWWETKQTNYASCWNLNTCDEYVLERRN